MNKLKTILSALTVLLISTSTWAQTDVKLTINHFLDGNEFAFNTEASNDLGHKFKLQRLEYYISGISIVHDGGKETMASDIYILAKADSKDTILLGNFDITSIEAINFSIGVDPSENNEDPTKWAASHPLAPKNPSMHWGWAAGYRFVALEGKSGNSFSQNFQIHALGNRNFFPQNIPVSANEVNGAQVISLNADYTKAVAGMDMNSGLVEHSEFNEAADCLRHFHKSVFTNLSGIGNTLSSNENEIPNALKLYPNPSNGQFSIDVADNRFRGAELKIVNILGETVVSINSIESTESISINTPGVYILSVVKGNMISTERFVIQ